MRDDIRENEGFEKENDINTESEANGIVKDMLCDNEGQEQVEEKLEADAEVLQAEGADNGEKESAAFEEEEAPCEEEKDACEKPLTGKDLTGDTRTCSDKKKGKKKKGKVAIISAITAAVLVFAIVIGTLLTTLLIGLGVVAVGGIGAVGLILFDMAEMQDVEIDPPLDNNVDMGFDEEMNVTKVDGVETDEGEQDPPAEDREMSVAEVVEQVADTVVEINATASAYNMMLGLAGGAGSGVIISENGYIITNHHVIQGAETITVRLADGREYEAGVVGSNAGEDIALLKIKATGLSVAVLGSSKDLVVGQEVVAIGNPLGTLGGTVTDGIISALDRTIIVDGQSMTLMQTNAAINPGNSGGGLFNRSGQLIGIVNAKQSDLGIEGLGFAIPIDTAWETVQDIKKNSK